MATKGSRLNPYTEDEYGFNLQNYNWNGGWVKMVAT